MNDCHCGCGAQITYADPSPDFKYPQCYQLWLASLDKPVPETWRAEQRILTLLLGQHWDWAETSWEFELTDWHIGMYDTSNGGDVQAGLRALYAAYDLYCRSYGRRSTLPILTRV